MVMDKTCKCCGRSLPESEFYMIRSWLDTTCKSCRKKRVRERYDANSKNPVFMENERVRSRDKYHRLYAGKKTVASQKKEKMYPSLRNAKRDFRVAPSRDIELHHWNYNNTNSVFALEKRLHHRLHKAITLNLEEGIYYFGQVKLDSAEKHEKVIYGICDEYGFDKSKVKLLTR